MYLKFFGLQKEPFHTTPDPRFLFLSPSHKEALATIIYGIEQRKGFIAVIGEVGVGKTTILRSYLEEIDSNQDRTIYIYNPNLTFNGLLQCILRELDQEPLSSEDADLIRQLQDILIQEYRKGGTVILLIDEAQNIPLTTLENLRMLSNLETTTDKLLQIVLIGQPELETLLKQQALRQLRQRIAVRATIQPLSKNESIAYVQHRLAKASTKPSAIFTPSTINLLAKEAKGIPRRLNILCDNALITGFGYQQKPVTTKTAREVARDIDGKQSIHGWRWASVTVGGLILIISLLWLQFPFFQKSQESSQLIALERVAENGTPGPVSPHKKPAVVTASEASSPDDPQNPGTPQTPSSPKGESDSTHSVASIDPNNDLKTLKKKKRGNVSRTTIPDQIESVRRGVTREKKTNRQSLSKTTISKQVLDHKRRNLKAQTVELANSNESGKRTQKSVSMPSKISTQISSQRLPKRSPERTSFKKSFIVHRIAKGDTLEKLIRAIYGTSNPGRVKWVLQHNPHIRSPRKLFPGQEILFPRLAEDEGKQK